MKKTFISSIVLLGIIVLAGTGCQKGNLVNNPNVASSNSFIQVSLILNRIDNEIYNGGGVMDDIADNYPEYAFTQTHRLNQFYLSTYPYYWGDNTYNWSNSATMYSVLKYVELMEQQTTALYGTTANPYTPLAKFFRAYLFVWYTQRVGDIPMSQAGNTAILTPAYDLQHDVYKNCLALLDTANTLMGALVPTLGTTTVTGDIYGLTVAQWQKVINSYKLRVLISLSKRAADNPDLNIPAQFATIINNPAQYPILESNTDNLQFTYNSSVNYFPNFPDQSPYDYLAVMSSTMLNITTASKDPRTFVMATPAPYQVSDTGLNKSLSDFTAYVGGDINLSIPDLFTNAGNGQYSYPNALKYFVDKSGVTEGPYIIVGYPEMCFNIAEAAYLGWIDGSQAGTWYTNGIKGSLAYYGLQDGTVIPIGDQKANSLGSVTANVTTFLSNVAYVGNTTAGLTQILQQKYVAFWMNSGFEAYYNWRRTGIPAFGQGGVGIGTSNNEIPLRWMYPNDEQTENTASWQKAITSQYGGTDDITKPMWLIK